MEIDIPPRCPECAAIVRPDVVLFGENDAATLIRALQPDVVCKGGEYRGERIPEQEAIEALGGTFVHLRQIPGSRTSLLLERIS